MLIHEQVMFNEIKCLMQNMFISSIAFMSEITVMIIKILLI